MLVFGTVIEHCFTCNITLTIPPLNSFCSSAQTFASSFLQIPFHNGHLCSCLMLLTVNYIRDFHLIAVNHALRTSSRKVAISSLPVLSHHRTYRSVYGGSFSMTGVYSYTVPEAGIIRAV